MARKKPVESSTNLASSKTDLSSCRIWCQVSTWSLEQLEGRVEVMREIFHKFHELPPEKRAKKCGISAPANGAPVDLSLPKDTDPWLPHGIVKTTEVQVVHDQPAPYVRAKATDWRAWLCFGGRPAK
ncbi:hypothetical protein FOL47_001351 [Perkinsus chesapeaki]|uniref:Uncharacterized protein n=1 Tax=Perkinsus chesapeaki TaxID=330153 RepID=A0A7J6MJ80_PERCH|nr:hypothetical protein FOL47_001351 [Perkinsus chesapeaki]